MQYLSEAFKTSNSIQELILHYNNLHENENNMLYLSEALKINYSIQMINLEGNKLGLK